MHLFLGQGMLIMTFLKEDRQSQKRPLPIHPREDTILCIYIRLCKSVCNSPLGCLPAVLPSVNHCESYFHPGWLLLEQAHETSLADPARAVGSRWSELDRSGVNHFWHLLLVGRPLSVPYLQEDPDSAPRPGCRGFETIHIDKLSLQRPQRQQVASQNDNSTQRIDSQRNQ